MLYPLSYWSFFIAAPPALSKRDSKIITADRARLKRGAASMRCKRGHNENLKSPKIGIVTNCTIWVKLMDNRG